MQALATAIDAAIPLPPAIPSAWPAWAWPWPGSCTTTNGFSPRCCQPSDMEELLYAGLLHDVGKIGIREEVLTKPPGCPLPTST